MTTRDWVSWLGSDSMGDHTILVVGPNGEPRVRAAGDALSVDLQSKARRQPTHLVNDWIARLRWSLEAATAWGSPDKAKVVVAEKALLILDAVVREGRAS